MTTPNQSMPFPKDSEACYFQKIFTTAPQNGKRKPNRTTTQRHQQETLSIALGMLSNNDLEKQAGGLLQGEVVHLSFDCPKPLREAMKQTAQRNGLSLCKMLCVLGAACVVADQRKEHAFSNTIGGRQPLVSIGALNFEQYCQTKPRRWMGKAPEDVKACSPEGVKGEFCQIEGCRKIAVSSGVYLETGKEYSLCSFHRGVFVKQSKNWKETKK